MRRSRRAFLKDVGLAAATVGALSVEGCRAPAGQIDRGKQKPNIIYILADDLGYGDLGCFGQKKIKTPNLDRMAAEGMKLTQHYAGSTVCAPSRCCLMTGKHTGHCTVRGNVDVLMKSEEMTVAKALRQAGYSTACIGKWGIGHPPPPDCLNTHSRFQGWKNRWGMRHQASAVRIDANTAGSGSTEAATASRGKQIPARTVSHTAAGGSRAASAASRSTTRPTSAMGS